MKQSSRIRIEVDAAGTGQVLMVNGSPVGKIVHAGSKIWHLYLGAATWPAGSSPSAALAERKLTRLLNLKADDRRDLLDWVVMTSADYCQLNLEGWPVGVVERGLQGRWHARHFVLGQTYDGSYVTREEAQQQLCLLVGLDTDPSGSSVTTAPAALPAPRHEGYLNCVRCNCSLVLRVARVDQEVKAYRCSVCGHYACAECLANTGAGGRNVCQVCVGTRVRFIGCGACTQLLHWDLPAVHAESAHICDTCEDVFCREHMAETTLRGIELCKFCAPPPRPKPYRAFSHWPPAWHSARQYSTGGAPELEDVYFGLKPLGPGPVDGSTGELRMVWVDLQHEKRLSAQLQVVDDAWAVMATMSDVFRALGRRDNQALSAEAFCQLLTELGFKNESRPEAG